MRRLRESLGMAALAASATLAGCEARGNPTIANTTITVVDTTTPTNPGQPILLSPASANLQLGDTLRLSASGGVSGVSLTWGTNAPGVVTVQSTSGTTALIRAIGTGTGSVTVSVVGDPARNAASTITVTP